MSASTGSLGFDIDIAMKVGVDCAVLYKNISYWTEINKANKKNYFEGRYWTYNSARAFSELFPFWNARKIVRMLETLEESGLILSGEFNKNKYDRTKWYTALSNNDKSISQNMHLHLPKMTNGVTENVKPIPNINTDIKQNTMSTKNKEKKYTNDDVRLVDALFFTIARVFPNHKALAARKPKDSDYMEMNKLHRLDGYEYSKIEAVLKWLFTAYKPNNSFDWKRNIQSPGKLRKHFFELSELFDSEKKKGNYNNIAYSTKPPSERKPTAVPVDDKPQLTPEEAKKNIIILKLIRLKKIAPNEMKSMKSKTIDELEAMARSV